jgi:PEP-CTERM motif
MSERAGYRKGAAKLMWAIREWSWECRALVRDTNMSGSPVSVNPLSRIALPGLARPSANWRHVCCNRVPYCPAEPIGWFAFGEQSFEARTGQLSLLKEGGPNMRHTLCSTLVVGFTLLAAIEARAATITFSTVLVSCGNVLACPGGPPSNSLIDTVSNAYGPGNSLTETATMTVVPISGTVAVINPGGAGAVVPFARHTVDTSNLSNQTLQQFSIGVGSVSMFLTLTDQATNAFGTLQFSGIFEGSVFSRNFGNRIETAYFPDPTFGGVGQTRVVQVGNTFYNVTLLNTGLVLNSPGLIESGTLQVAVSQVPEPATLMLVGTGVLATWRLRRRKRNGAGDGDRTRDQQLGKL